MIITTTTCLLQELQAILIALDVRRASGSLGQLVRIDPAIQSDFKSQS